MRPRKSTRLIAKAEAAEAASWTAGREVYRCADVRREILRLLTRPDLTRCMRVSKEAMEDVARILYKTRSGDQMAQYVGSSELRHKIYCSSLTDLLEPPSWSIEQLREALEKESKLPLGTGGAIYTELMAKLQEQYPNFRRLHIDGTGYARSGPSEFWVIQMDPARREYDEPTPPDHPPPIPPLQIEIVHNRTAQLHEEPPKAFENPYPSSHVNIITYRFNLHLTSPPYRHMLGEPRTDEWLKFIRESPTMGNIHKNLDLLSVPVTIDDLIAVYGRQTSYGHSQRLASISVWNMPTYSIEGFGRLAKVAGTSLTALKLSHGGQPRNTWPDFSRLPALVSIIKRDLVNLEVLSISMGGIERAEEVCGALLQQEALDQEGSLSRLEINAGVAASPMYNTLRYLSVLCRRQGEVVVGTMDKKAEWNGDMQTKLLEYLRSQSPAARSHLSTIDFPASLDITSPAQVMELQYDDDGRPLPRREVKATGWHDISLALENYATQRIPTLTKSLASLAASSKRFKKAATQKSTDQMLEEAEELLLNIKKAVDAADLGRTIIHNAVDMRKEIKEFVNTIKDINGIDRDLEVEDDW